MVDDFRQHDGPVKIPRCPIDGVPMWVGDGVWVCADCTHTIDW